VQAADVLDLVSALDGLEAVYWLDGGWGVDCLLREETRQHSDLDLVVDRRDLGPVMAHLHHHGYEVIRDWRPTSIAFRDQTGREVDLHPVDATVDGGGDQVLEDGSTWHYSAPVEGAIVGHAVRCAPPEDQLLMHLGYDPRPVDFADIRRIAARFNLPLPRPFGNATDVRS
jgi:lincosamide nucleotidyltransferase A/C/D/E